MFITFEGIDAAGKTTQIEHVERYFKSKGYQTVVTRQPGGTKIGYAIRQLLLDPENREMVSEVELLLYMADRVQHLRQVILPALEQEKVVLCDRYHDATIAYQGYGRGIDLQWMSGLEHQWIRKPDLTFWINLPAEESKQRIEHRNQVNGEVSCRIEEESLDFFNRVNQGYAAIYRAEPERVVSIMGTQTIEEVTKQILSTLESRL